MPHENDTLDDDLVMPIACCDDLISLAHHNELSLLLGYEEMKRITKHIPEYNLEKFLDIDQKKFLCILR